MLLLACVSLVITMVTAWWTCVCLAVLRLMSTLAWVLPWRNSLGHFSPSSTPNAPTGRCGFSNTWNMKTWVSRSLVASLSFFLSFTCCPFSSLSLFFSCSNSNKLCFLASKERKKLWLCKICLSFPFLMTFCSLSFAHLNHPYPVSSTLWFLSQSLTGKTSKQ